MVILGNVFRLNKRLLYLGTLTVFLCFRVVLWLRLQQEPVRKWTQVRGPHKLQVTTLLLGHWPWRQREQTVSFPVSIAKTHLFHWFYAFVFPIFITIASLCCFSVLLKTLKPFICLLRTRDLWFKAFHLTLLWFYRAYCTIKQCNRICFCHSPAISSIIWLTIMFNIAFVDLVSVCLLWPELLESLSLRTFSCKHSTARMNHTLEIYTLYLVSNLSVLTFSCVRYLCDPAM